jgi:hypothetical protein
MTSTSNQYSVVEYRRRAGTNYDLYLPNEGLLIYRINANFDGNAGFDAVTEFDEVYLYRIGSSQTNGVYSPGNLDQAPYNASNGKTEFNSTTNPKPCQSNGTPETQQNINNILYDYDADSYTFFYGDPENRNLSVSPNELSFDQNSGSTHTVTVSSNVLWNVTIPLSATSWLSASKTKGMNNGSVTFTTISTNTGQEPRTAIITFTGNELTFNVNITQAGLGGDVIVNVSANPVAGGTVTGGGTYPCGTTVSVAAVANTDYLFTNWTNGSTIVSTEETYSFTATENVDLAANFIKDVGINKMETIAGFTIYPNPANDQIKVVRLTAENAKIDIYNNIGALIQSLEVNEIETTINISALTSGAYLIKITDKQNSHIQRLLKE